MVVVITITTILSMVLEETVRAMRKKDTWDKVVQPALYVRRSVFIDLKILHLQENFPLQIITFAFHHQVEECSGVQDCFCELTPVSLNFALHKYF